jgi:hypothetical protein
MPPKRARRTVAAAVATSEEEPSRNAPGAFQLPPYKQTWPIMWYKQAESFMDMRKITNPTFRLVLVRCALPNTLQESVAHIPASAAYTQLKAELTRMHKKTAWGGWPNFLPCRCAAPRKARSCSRPCSSSGPRTRNCGSNGCRYFS